MEANLGNDARAYVIQVRSLLDNARKGLFPQASPSKLPRAILAFAPYGRSQQNSWDTFGKWTSLTCHTTCVDSFPYSNDQGTRWEKKLYTKIACFFIELSASHEALKCTGKARSSICLSAILSLLQ